MPTFNNVEITETADLDFEVYCAGCNAGLCSNCTTKKTYNRGANRLDIEPCKRCSESAREEGADKAREEMQARIDELESELLSQKP